MLIAPSEGVDKPRLQNAIDRSAMYAGKVSWSTLADHGKE